MELILVRHGETDWNKEYRVQGQSDLPLNENGRKQAEAIALMLKDANVRAIYSSPLSRAFETAKRIDSFHGVGVAAVNELKELDVGELDGLYYPDIETKYPEFFKVWSTDAAAAKFPGGESLPQLQERVWGAVRGIIAQNQKDPVVVASHFFALLTVLCTVLNLNLSDFRRLNISVASISAIEFTEEGTRIICLNETCHLEKLHDTKMR